MQQRSLWGWGYEDQIPDAEGCRALGQLAASFLGVSAAEPREPPVLGQITLPEPRITCPLPWCGSDKRARVLHARGKGYPDLVKALDADFAVAPDLVAKPSTEEEIERTLAWAEQEHVAVVPYGGGTSVVQGVECSGEGYNGVLSLDMQGFDQVLEVDTVSRNARIGAGVLGPSLEAQLAQHGHTLRHFPQSFEFSTLGGWIATRAGGHFATNQTHIDDFVSSVRMITPRGAWESWPLPASGAGPDPNRWVIGSEGTLGVITQAWMRIQPRPRYRSSAAVLFTDWTAAIDAVRAIVQTRLWPSNCRLLDKREALINQVATGQHHVLLLGFESASDPVDALLLTVVGIAKKHGGHCPEAPRHRDAGDRIDTEGAATSWRSGFVRGPYLQSALATVGILVDTFETACTWTRFPALHEDVVGSVRDCLKRVGGAALLTCRLTHVYEDGPAPYYTFFTRARRGEELEQWSEIKQTAMDALLRHQATITHHHAVGRLHRPGYDRERPELFATALRAVKQSLDPAGILNPGVLV